MVSMNDIISYVFETPYNTNITILRQLLTEFAEGSSVPESVIPCEDCIEKANADALYFANSVYNKVGANQSLTREDEIIGNNYFVAVANNVSDNARVIIGDELKSSNDTFALSVGNNSSVRENYYYIEDDTCYVAFPMILFYDITINGQIVVDNADKGKLVITGMKVVGEGEIIPAAGDKYIANIRKKNSYIDLGLQGVEANEMVLSKKIYNGNLSYGFIKVDEIVEGIPAIGYYPFRWASTDQAWIDMDDVATTIYTLFAISTNASTTIEIEARKLNAIDDEEEIIYDGGGVQS